MERLSSILRSLLSISSFRRRAFCRSLEYNSRRYCAVLRDDVDRAGRDDDERLQRDRAWFCLPISPGRENFAERTRSSPLTIAKQWPQGQSLYIITMQQPWSRHLAKPSEYLVRIRPSFVQGFHHNGGASFSWSSTSSRQRCRLPATCPVVVFDRWQASRQPSSSFRCPPRRMPPGGWQDRGKLPNHGAAFVVVGGTHRTNPASANLRRSNRCGICAYDKCNLIG